MLQPRSPPVSYYGTYLYAKNVPSGNLVQRYYAVASQTENFSFDFVDRLTAVSGGASFIYDGDGNRVKKTENGQTILYINKYYEKNLTTGVATTYYYLGGRLIALRTGSQLNYIHHDHLSGTALTTSSGGSLTGTIAYHPFGTTRSFSGTLPAQKFTGQRLDGTGLYFYNARYY
ncbi:MAG TPA: hypothetical protein VLH15_00355, partial [Dehalococcoidales bacterium]|nr:hypothetical protein [Dehalococcoidales bacterium]